MLKTLFLTCFLGGFSTFALAQDQLLIFVSLSMPEASLKSLYHDVSAQKGRLIVRGLTNNLANAKLKCKSESRSQVQEGLNARADPSTPRVWGWRQGKRFKNSLDFRRSATPN